ncbi:hypothetical protein GCM10020218_062940 [Dactylosporangium vinaceum]
MRWPAQVPARTSAIPATAAALRCSPAMPTPIRTAHTGSVPSRRLARAADVRRIAHSCTRNANTLQPRARYSTPSQCPGPKARTAAGRSGAARAVNRAAPTTVCSQVSVTVSYCRPPVSRPDSVTWAARTTAAASISASPAVGARRPGPATSRTTPPTATAAATKNRPGSHRRCTAPSSTGVSRIVRLISTPAFVALVSDTPNVSSTSTDAWVSPSSAPTRSCAHPGRRPAIAGVSASAETRNRSAKTASTPPASTSVCAAR